ncbi:uncharacterized protein MELLADRAFT_59307 [Melampsora larici-populina 98AG31]|uniref:Uncharacterized protein n=1 Tax=Melampsora larici-populina (strain 98AG31 / pathotype 3-4-7) TaxID=747676 RepID=F4R5U2_MELLP|nr:uncharacterized protein MELLADRAFT_59307 [Melampsora larici-populina 98AG31]EGG12194.1 hypothetical protein MELLADRAFT_59307 [Melampsora larici-populina 98AG31]
MRKAEFLMSGTKNQAPDNCAGYIYVLLLFDTVALVMMVVRRSIAYLKYHITNARDWFAACNDSTLGTTVQTLGTHPMDPVTFRTPSLQTKSTQTCSDPFRTPEPTQSDVFNFSYPSSFSSEISDDGPLAPTPGDPFLAPGSTNNRELEFLGTNHNNTLIDPSCFLRTANWSPALTSSGISMLLDAADVISHWHADSPITHKNRGRAEVLMDIDTDQFRTHGSERSSVENVQKEHKFISPLPTPSLHIASGVHDQLQSSSRHSSEYTTFGASDKQHSRFYSLSRFQDSGSGVFNQLQSHSLESSAFEAGMIRYHPYPSYRHQNSPPGIVKQLRSRGVESSSIRAGIRRDKFRSSSPPLSLQHSASQELLLPPNDHMFEGDVPSAAEFEGSENGGKKVLTCKIEEAMPSISNCECRLSATHSILASALGPLEILLKSNTCDGYKYKETAHIFLKIFDEVREVQGCVGHVHNCPNSEI